MKKILLICNESKTVVNFRKELIVFLTKKDYSISLIIGDDEFLPEIKKLGVDVHIIPFTNRSLNPFATLSLIRKFKRVIKQDNPDVIFTFQIKPNIFGAIAASKASNAPVFSMVEGLGDPFQPKNFKGKIVRLIVSKLYKRAFKSVNKVFFLNNYDKEEFISRKLIDDKKCVVIPGIGIDTTNYVPSYNLPKEAHIVFIGRLIENKGVYEFCSIAKKVRESRKDIYFDIYGSESQIKISDLRNFINDGIVSCHGYSTDIKNVVANSLILLSTSYREGFPRTIMEAMALGRTTIASNVVGNRDVIVDGVTGYLIEKEDIDGFSKKIIELVNDQSLLIKIGQQARKYCEEHYDSETINGIIANTMEQEK